MKSLTALALSVATPVLAEDLPDFATCMDIEMARYERALLRLRNGSDDPEFTIGGTNGVEFCGTAGIVLCDRSGDTVPCQEALRAQEDGLRVDVLAALPAPEDVPRADGKWWDGLYHRVHALAHGRSAGEDCGGAPPLLSAWCEAREANRRLALAVRAWQIARFHGVVPDAVTAGWAHPPPPVRPVARPEGKP